MIPEVVKRLAPTKDTLNLLFSLSGNVCAFPGCTHPIFDSDNNFIAQVCHIESANEGGERFNRNSTNEDRRQYSNLLILCYEHHKVTDNVALYTTEKMVELKHQHEKKFRPSPSYISNDQIDTIFYNETKKIQEISSDTKNILDKQNEQTEILRQILALQLTKTENHTIPKTDFDKQIDFIISLRLKNNHKTAIILFQKLKEENWENMSDREKYRIQANLGILYLDLGENEKAAEQFIDSLKYQPDDPSAIDYGILGYSLVGNDIEAELLIEKGLKIDPKNVGIYASLIRIKETLSVEEILSLIPAELHQETEIAFQIFRKYKNEHKFEDAITWGQTALDGCTEENSEMKAILASTILESIQNPFKVVTGQVSQESKNKATYAIKLFTQAWENVKNTELRIERVWYLINRGVTKTYLADFEGSYDDAKEASIISNDVFALRHLAVEAMRSGKQREAFETLQKLKAMVNGNELFETKYFEAHFFQQFGQVDLAISKIENLLLENIDDVLKFNILENLTQYYTETSDLSKAKKYNKLAFDLSTNSLSPLILKGKILLKENLKEQAIITFSNGLKKVNENTLEVDIYDLSLQFDEVGMSKESILLLERISNPNTFSPTTKKLLELYYKYGEDSKLLKSCDNLIKVFGPISFISELKSYVLEKINDSRNAIATCQQYLSVYPKDQNIQIRLALIYSRLGDWSNIKAIVQSIDHVDRSLSLDLQFRLAFLCYSCGEKKKALEFAYETRRQFQEDVSAHEAFINLGLNISQGGDNPLDPILVEDNCKVTITDSSTTVSYLIENRADLTRLKGEISLDSAEGKVLLGKRIGETVILGKYDQKFIVHDIKHKYNAAMSESFKLIQTTFITQTNFRKFTIGKTGDLLKDFKPIFENLDAVSSQNIKIEENYKLKILPLSTIAKIKNVNLISVWSAYTSDETLGVYTTINNTEIEQAFKNFDNKIPLLFDLISLCTIAQLNFYEDIKLLNCDFYIAESTILAINHFLHELKSPSSINSMMIGKKDGQYFRQITTSEEIKRHIDHYYTLLEWIKNNCEILPCTAALKLNGHIKEKNDDLLGESTFDSILTAQDKNYVLYAEEEVIRTLAFQQYQLRGTATFIAILYLFSRKKIDHKTYLKLYIKLIKLNYTHLPIDSNILFEIAVKTKYKFNYPLTAATTCLNSNLLSPYFMLNSVCEYFIALYKRPSIFSYEKNLKELKKNLILKTLIILNEKYDIKQLEIRMLQILRTKISFVDPDYISISRQIIFFCHPFYN